MINIRIPIICSILALFHSGSAFAQTDAANKHPYPLPTEKALNTTTVGQAKPPSRDASPTSVQPVARLTPRQVADDTIAMRVCAGCGGEPTTTGALPTSTPSRPAEKRDLRLDELRTATEPQKQSDLDTVALASAHREQAKSVDDKTSGLWQSWVVSVCEGCGDQKPAKALKLEDWPKRNAPLATGSVDPKAPAAKAGHADAKGVEVRRQSSLEADLSPQNVDQIRRMP